jgi:hypothetical protein
MRRGQAFTMDLFSALTIFLIVMFLVLLFAGWIVAMQAFNDRLFKLEGQVITAEDYITLSGDTASSPYVLNKAAVGTLFGKSQSDIITQFSFTAANYSMKIIRLNDSATVLSSGYNSTQSEYSVAIDRFVVYDGQPSVLRVEAWQPKAST